MAWLPWLVAVVTMGVDMLLLWGVSARWGLCPGICRVALAMLPGGIYTCLCLLWGQDLYLGRFLLWAVSGWICFGFAHGGFYRGVWYAVLAATVTACATVLGGNAVKGTGVAALLLGCLCLWELWHKDTYIPVMLSWGQHQAHILALRDTGHTLRDPVSGEPVLVAGPSVAKSMLGLTKEDLSAPAETLVSSHIKGLRLIPYRSVGQSSGLMLAIRIPCARVGLRKGSVLVAFTPTVLDPKDRYHALAGGVL